ncbi:FAD-dependent oxidoreductase [Amycolatopsis sp. DSM 110486]|uniref:FAD-dependent oxidoreductase n=1 Tax=Amycolatopsis sp. DSM 110486 TaxID=2865832 RepID=UPI001C6A66D7|nr:FAD-dependent oxidoreductase [Amycolatopsis sp. DSM 110486]QYN22458.1 FAD-dependent oxidoreductase [Amycolatopsis sp. DSM 110486]
MTDVDVIVVGAGGGGLTAALAAHDAGASVVVLEKAEHAGGNTALSTGSVPGAGTRFQAAAGIDDSAARLATDLLAQSGSHDADDLARLLAAGSAGLVEWLIDTHGVDLRLITDYKHVGHSVPRLHAPPSRKGRDLVADLLGAVRATDTEVLVHTPVAALLHDEGRVTGVRVSGPRSGTYEITSHAVVLAGNGFAANRALLREWAPAIAGFEYFGAHGSTGESLQWALDLGARLGNPTAYQGYAAVAYPHGSITSWTTVEMGGVLVNGAGRRFGDESRGYSGYADAVLGTPGPWHVVFDTKIRDYVASHEEEFADLVAMGGARECASVEELATFCGVSPSALSTTLASAATVASGDDKDEWGRTDWGFGPLHAPYVAVRSVPGLFHTQGGLLVDGHARPTTDTGPIPGLYAVGGVATGISGHTGGAGYSSGNGLLAALGLGHLAGTHAGSLLR